MIDELDEILSGVGEEITLRLTNGAEISGAQLVEKRLAECGLVTLVHPYEGAVNLYRTSRGSRGFSSPWPSSLACRATSGEAPAPPSATTGEASHVRAGVRTRRSGEVCHARGHGRER